MFGRKKSDSQIQAQRQRPLPSSTAPRADTAVLVPVVSIVGPMLLLRDGRYTVMLEFPAMDYGPTGENFDIMLRRYQQALERLPAGYFFQIIVLGEPWDPTSDLSYFLDRARSFYNQADNSDTSINGARYTASACGDAANVMAARLAYFFDKNKPMAWRTILVISHQPGIQIKQNLAASTKSIKPKELERLKTLANPAWEELSSWIGLYQQAFSASGISLRQLSPGEMCQVVWRALHPETAGSESVSAERTVLSLAEQSAPPRRLPPPVETFDETLGPDDLAALLSPNTVVETENYVEVDDVLVKPYIVYDYKPHQLARLYRLSDHPWSGALFVEVADPALVIGKLENREVQLRATQQMRAGRGQLPDFRGQQEADTVTLARQQLTTSGQPLMYIRLFVMITAPDEKTLAVHSRKLEATFTTYGISAYHAKYQTMHVWQSSHPFNIMHVSQKPRNMTAASLSSFYWLPRMRLSNEDGIYLGITGEGVPYYMDLFGQHKEKTPTVLTIGRQGAGKSVTLRMALVSALLARYKVMAIDLEGEMKDVCKKYGGRYIEIGTTGGERVNVLDIPPDADDPLIAGTEQLIAFVEAVKGETIPHGPEWNVLADAYKACLVDRGWVTEEGLLGSATSWSHEDAPRLVNVVRVLEHLGPVGVSLAEVLRPYADGLYAGYFNNQTTFNIEDEQLVVFGLQHVQMSDASDRLRVYLWQVMGTIWGEIQRRYQINAQEKQIIMLDEVWALLDAPGGAAAIENIARRSRKRGTALWMATQHVQEFVDTPAGRRIFNIIGSVLIMAQTKQSAPGIAGIFNLTSGMADVIANLPTGQGILMLPHNSTVALNIDCPHTEWGTM